MKQSLRYGALVVTVAVTATLASCSNKITEEQLARLRELRQQETTLTQQIRAKRDDRTRLQGEINTRRAELDRCNQDKAFVQGKLSQWPDVWPDWKATPATPPTGSQPRR